MNPDLLEAAGVPDMPEVRTTNDADIALRLRGWDEFAGLRSQLIAAGFRLDRDLAGLR